MQTIAHFLDQLCKVLIVHLHLSINHVTACRVAGASSPNNTTRRQRTGVETTVPPPIRTGENKSPVGQTHPHLNCENTYTGMGRETGQGEVAVEFDRKCYRISDFDGGSSGAGTAPPRLRLGTTAHSPYRWASFGI